MRVMLNKHIGVKNSLSVKELILFSSLGAIMSISQIVLQGVPNVELVSLFTIIFALVYEKKSLYIVATFILVMGIFYGVGPWWLGYAIIWPILATITILIRNWIKENYLILSIYSAIFGLAFGGLYAIPYIFISDVTFAIAYWIRGLPYDFIHMVGNYFIMLFLGKHIYDLLIKLNKQYFK